MNRSNLRLPDSKVVNRVIVIKKRNVKNRAAASRAVANQVVANRAAVSNKADDKPWIAN